MGNFQSAYSPKRLAAIAKAINDWLATVSKPREKNAEAAVGMGYRVILKWARADFGPRPDSMLRLWRATGNRVFLLMQEERDIFLRRNFSAPSLEELPLGRPKDTPELSEEQLKIVKRKGSTGYQSAYCEDRKKEITAAIKDWRVALRGSGQKSDIAAGLLQVSSSTVSKWIAGKIFPGPMYMHQLWIITGKPVFLLRQEERDVFLARRQEIPRDYPLYEEYAAKHGLAVKKTLEKKPTSATAPEIVETRRDIEAFEGIPDKQVIVNTIIALNLICSIVCDLLGKYKGVALPENQRRRVAEIIKRLFMSLGLSEKDFLPKQQMEETDPAAKKRMERLFTTLAEPQA